SATSSRPGRRTAATSTRSSRPTAARLSARWSPPCTTSTRATASAGRVGSTRTTTRCASAGSSQRRTAPSRSRASTSVPSRATAGSGASPGSSASCRLRDPLGLVQAALQLRHLALEGCDAVLERRTRHGRLGDRGGRLLVRTEELHPAILLLARATADPADEFARGQLLEDALCLLRRPEAVQALGPELELSRRLCAAQHEHGEERDLCSVEPQRLVEQVAVFRRPASGAAGEPRPALVVEPRECL